MAVAAVEELSETLLLAKDPFHPPETSLSKEIKRKPRWFFGGLACTSACACTHPLDMMKVHLQTANGSKVHILRSMFHLAKTHGTRALYTGLTASGSREMIYSGARFAIYEFLKPAPGAPPAPFLTKVATAAFSGGFGGIIGAPFDLINVRMLSDVRQPLEKKRNYRNVVDGFVKIVRNEGVAGLYNGATMVVLRAICITVGQLSFYDHVKHELLQLSTLEDNVVTHLLSSAVAACAATTLAMPVDVMKTTLQNAKPGQYKGILNCAATISRTGLLSFYKGYTPAFTRVGIHTVITFLTFEQLRIHFGHDLDVD